jgi:hypothetical protein
MAILNNPKGVFVTSDGFVYIADTLNNRIRMISPSNIITTIAGTGNGGFSADGIPATSSDLYTPFHIYITTDKLMYIADSNNNRIRMVDSNGIITTIAGTDTAGYIGDGITPTSAYLNNPTSVFLSADMNWMYIADNLNQRVRSITGIVTIIYS